MKWLYLSFNHSLTEQTCKAQIESTDLFNLKIMSMPVINPTYTWKKKLFIFSTNLKSLTRQADYLHLHGQYENTMNEIPAVLVKSEAETRIQTVKRAEALYRRSALLREHLFSSSRYYSRNKDPDSEACWSAVQEISTSERASVSPAADITAETRIQTLKRCTGDQHFWESICFSSRSANLCCSSFSLSCCLWTSSLRAWW